MALGEWLRSDGPNGTLVAPEGSRSKSAVFVRCCSLQTVTIGRAVLFALLPRPADVLARFSDRVGIVEVSRRLAQQEHVLMRLRGRNRLAADAGSAGAGRGQDRKSVV